MRPLELEVVHAWSACDDVGGMIGRIAPRLLLKIGGRRDRTEGVGGLERTRDLFCYVQNGLYATFNETFPVTGVVF